MCSCKKGQTFVYLGAAQVLRSPDAPGQEKEDTVLR